MLGASPEGRTVVCRSALRGRWRMPVVTRFRRRPVAGSWDAGSTGCRWWLTAGGVGDRIKPDGKRLS